MEERICHISSSTSPPTANPIFSVKVLSNPGGAQRIIKDSCHWIRRKVILNSKEYLRGHIRRHPYHKAGS